MQEVELITRVISQDESGYEIDGMINPEFHNDGNTDVIIQSQRIAPNDSFKAGLPNHVSRGAVNIGFDESTVNDAVVNKVVLQYFRVIGPYTNPSSGLKYTDEQKLAARQHNQNHCN